jgi:hypothetical protein
VSNYSLKPFSKVFRVLCAAEDPKLVYFVCIDFIKQNIAVHIYALSCSNVSILTLNAAQSTSQNVTFTNYLKKAK